MTSQDLISQVKKRIANLTDTNLAIADLSLTNLINDPIQSFKVFIAIFNY